MNIENRQLRSPSTSARSRASGARNGQDPVTRPLRARQVSRDGSELELRERPGHEQMRVPAQAAVDDRIAAGGAGQLERIDRFVEPRAARTTTREARREQDPIRSDPLHPIELERHVPARDARRRDLGFLDGRTIRADRVLLATGFPSRRPGGAWLDEAVDALRLPCAACGYPIVDRGLRWHPRLLVTGALAELELGPVARNLSGAQRAGESIVAVAPTSGRAQAPPAGPRPGVD